MCELTPLVIPNMCIYVLHAYVYVLTCKVYVYVGICTCKHIMHTPTLLVHQMQLIHWYYVAQAGDALPTAPIGRPLAVFQLSGMAFTCRCLMSRRSSLLAWQHSGSAMFHPKALNMRSQLPFAFLFVSWMWRGPGGFHSRSSEFRGRCSTS